jgi:hypothetical protein
MAEQNGHANGRVVRVIGPVVDVEFPPGQLPEIYTALTTDITVDGETSTITCEVAQHIGESLVRTIALRPTDGLVRGTPVINTCSAFPSTFRPTRSTWRSAGRSTATRRRSRSSSRRRRCSRPASR